MTTMSKANLFLLMWCGLYLTSCSVGKIAMKKGGQKAEIRGI
jgi:hypothetical protein